MGEFDVICRYAQLCVSTNDNKLNSHLRRCMRTIPPIGAVIISGQSVGGYAVFVLEEVGHRYIKLFFFIMEFIPHRHIHAQKTTPNTPKSFGLAF